MAAFSITCPECKAVLKTSKAVPAGSVITCPKCQVMFAAPAPKVKAAVSAGVEVIEDDDEIIEDVEVVEEKKEVAKPKVREPRAKITKPKKSNTGLIIALCVGPVVLAAFGIGGYFMVRWLLTENTDAVAYVPDRAPIVFGFDIGKLGETAAGPALDQGMAASPLGKYCESINSTPRNTIHKLVMGMSFTQNRTPTTSMVMVSRSSIDKSKLAAAFGGTAATYGGRSVYQTGTAPAQQTLVVGSKVAAMIGGNEAEDVVRTAGRNRPDPGITDMVAKAKNGDVWVVVNTQAQGLMEMANAGPAMPGMPKLTSEMTANVKCVGLWATIGFGEVDISIHIQTPDSKAAETMSADTKKQFDSMKGVAGQAMLMMLGNGQAVAKEFVESASVATKDATVMLTAKVKLSTLEPAIQALAAMAPAMGAPQQPGAGGGRGPRGR